MQRHFVRVIRKTNGCPRYTCPCDSHQITAMPWNVQVGLDLQVGLDCAMAEATSLWFAGIECVVHSSQPTLSILTNQE